ncbi:MAG: YciI family protein [Gammaproteobacteria bacterium]|uniref:YciI family protein n=1 Tax=Rhodoferax sp. TaxID=50421 RepID=UPI001835FFB5|nr:YciI family protein [Rhodoferax sp.]MBU3899938.1 YciI family protein [Gammaproteobacteria bacterium]MBA3057322.1 YciI family protein [Rhodoferax sp.]MBU3995998.1 YciI family protein [Gammaproteobacteria bacterium]MBU4019204.1 YciI family protein [Gammaproteobacteria bacterium]MBU4078922.1 YciI family protein [Gammaproteobacteria bacterium]
MRFMIIVKSCPAFEAELSPAAPEELMAEMAAYHEELMRAGVLLDGSGLHPSRSGWRVHYGPEGKRIVDGPFAEAKELIAGYTLIQVRNREEALEWSRRFPNPAGRGMEAVIEVRQLMELDEFPPGQALDKFKQMEANQKA